MDSSKTTESLQRIYRLRTLQHSQFCSVKEEQHMDSSKTIGDPVEDLKA
jgi:hypothetical protein